ncbi:hypothetical protein OXPF_14100 [Oxobacter pfennigii]|uniref:Prepilin-type N-terminal cleavage/methylation domain-containing protein n=1 Tax=Oxobacter pfennigii TaxID=36849 RepID=A0A0P8X290_9CLOT|nr:prepilin-type N-terminal cleavage/methylation domain-containing protein [Oxobacter pfennigii]KPU44932.1 hypothetical protein OXPF_14100 [Oxobacter pfennigii]
MKIVKKSNGYTLIELLCTISILSLVTAMSYEIYSYSLKAYKEYDITWEIQQDLRHALDAIAVDVRNADILSVAKGDWEDEGKSILTLNVKGKAVIIKWTYDSDKQRALYRIVNNSKNLIIRNIEDIAFDNKEGFLKISITTEKYGKTYNSSVVISKKVDKFQVNL